MKVFWQSEFIDLLSQSDPCVPGCIQAVSPVRLLARWWHFPWRHTEGASRRHTRPLVTARVWAATWRLQILIEVFHDLLLNSSIKEVL